MNMLELPGPEFLKLYLTFLAGAIALLILLRYMLRGPSDEPPKSMPRFGALEMAYLSRGRRGAVDAAIASLVHREVLKVKMDGTRPRVSATGVLAADAMELEARVYKTAAMTREGMLLGPLRRAAADAAETLAQPLRHMELLLSGGRLALARFLPVMPLVLCLIIGVQKVIIGISRGRPVGFLVGLCAATLIVLLFALGRTPHRTRRGDKVLAKLRSENASLNVSSIRQMSPVDVAMAFGLFGPAVLAADQDLYRAMKNSAQGSASCGSGGCGSSGCGGGCGGGGCGGCGGD